MIESELTNVIRLWIYFYKSAYSLQKSNILQTLDNQRAGVLWPAFHHGWMLVLLQSPLRGHTTATALTLPCYPENDKGFFSGNIHLLVPHHWKHLHSTQYWITKIVCEIAKCVFSNSWAHILPETVLLQGMRLNIASYISFKVLIRQQVVV